jgi:hypothetical protein
MQSHAEGAFMRVPELRVYPVFASFKQEMFHDSTILHLFPFKTGGKKFPGPFPPKTIE